jgi:hypothetical protein
MKITEVRGGKFSHCSQPLHGLGIGWTYPIGLGFGWGYSSVIQCILKHARGHGFNTQQPKKLKLRD